jgi:hypothetical protein
MKKIVMMLAMASFVVFLAACGGKGASQSEASGETATPAAETVAPAAAEGDLLAKYEAFVNKATGLITKVAAGDAAAAQEWQKLVQDYTTLSQELAAQSANFNEAQIKKLQELSQKWADAASKAYGQQ